VAFLFGTTGLVYLASGLAATCLSDAFGVFCVELVKAVLNGSRNDAEFPSDNLL
jgi:hypothetical protein